jgi:hypothetical protein
VTIELCVEGTGTRSSNTLDLKNPYFRYTGQAAQPPPGVNHTSPSETYWGQLDAQGARQGEFVDFTDIIDRFLCVKLFAHSSVFSVIIWDRKVLYVCTKLF